jgi:hypothetical protein
MNRPNSDLVLYSTSGCAGQYRAVFNIRAGRGFEIFASGETPAAALKALNVVRQHVFNAWCATTTADYPERDRDLRAFEAARLEIADAMADA